MKKTSEIVVFQNPKPVNILNLIDRLKDNPILLAQSLTKRINDIALSDNSEWINATFDVYVKARSYDGLYKLWESSVDPRIIIAGIQETVSSARLRGMGFGGYRQEEQIKVPASAYEKTRKRKDYLINKFRELPKEHRIHLSNRFLGDKQEEYLLCPLEALKIVEGLEEQVEIENNLINKPQFYQCYPVTAVKIAAKNENYDAVGITFAHLREKGDYWFSNEENKEIKTLREELIDMNEFQRVQSLTHRDDLHETERDKMNKKVSEMYSQMIEGFNNLLYQMKKPEKAFEGVARIFRKNARLSLAVEYAILSNNTDLLFEISKNANLVSSTPSIYEARPVAFKGLKALLVDERFSINDETRSRVKEELAKTFDERWAYHSNEESAIEAAQLSGDYSFLKRNFLESFNRGDRPYQKVYDILITKQEISSSDVIRLVEEHIKKNLGNGEKIIKSLGFARFVSSPINQELMEKAFVGGCVDNDKYARDALDYMTKYNLHTPTTRVYMEIEFGN